MKLLLLIKKSRTFDVNIIGVDSSKDAVGKYFCDIFYQIPDGKMENHILGKKSYFIIKKSDLVKKS